MVLDMNFKCSACGWESKGGFYSKCAHCGAPNKIQWVEEKCHGGAVVPFLVPFTVTPATGLPLTTEIGGTITAYFPKPFAWPFGFGRRESADDEFDRLMREDP